jgi:acetoacetyl-CoA synthetase
MNGLTEGTLLWTPSSSVQKDANLSAYMAWLEKERGKKFDNYHELWAWSVTDLEHFWDSIWDYFQVKASQNFTNVLDKREMPGAKWFDGAKLNFAEHIFRNATDKKPALLYKGEAEPLQKVSWQELIDKTTAFANYLKSQGVQSGDRVVAYMPNIPESIIAFLACVSLGAIWSSCSPDFGIPGVLDRFQQIEPKILLAVDGYRWNGKIFDRRRAVADIQKAMPSLENTVLVSHVFENGSPDIKQHSISWNQALESGEGTGSLEFEQVPFSHPLWVLYSSGTTGLPKPIVHGHGGILIEHLKTLTLHFDLTPNDNFFWYTSTGWMMWNIVVGTLLVGSTGILYDGSPGYPDMNVLWDLVNETKMTYFGTSAAYVSACINAGIEPGRRFDLTSIRAVGSTGSPLTTNGFAWIYENVHPDLALESLSGGTDLCTPFVGGCRLLPVHAGEIQCRYLGAKVESFNENGESIIDQVGELVVTEPMPSMPLFFWNDPEDRRYKASYFELFPGIWRHGDWIKIKGNGGSVIYGRSDSTINRHGVRMGTSEIYQAIRRVEGVEDGLVVDLEILGGKSYMPLFVVLKEGVVFDDGLIETIKQRIRQDISPRHVPDEVFTIQEIPRTLSGKKMEVPIRKILMGFPVEEAVNRGAMRNPETIDFFVDLAPKIQKR